MASFIKLVRTPIREIIFTISFSENVEIDKIEEFTAISSIHEKFSTKNKGFNTHVESKGNEQPTARISSDGYILKCDQSSRIIQARRGSFSYHKVGGYEKFEVLISELRLYWDLFLSKTGKLTVNNLSVRYLNLIEKEEKEKWSDLVTIYPSHPFGDNIDNCINQLRFFYNANRSIYANVITTKGKLNNENGIILDIILNKKIQDEVKDEIVFGLFDEMREAKNEIFFKSITERTIQKYNHE